MNDLRNELAVITAALSDLESALTTLTEALASHPPVDMSGLTQEVARLRSAMASPPPSRRDWSWMWSWSWPRTPVALLAGGLCVALVTWQTWWPTPGREREVLRAIDQVLVVNYVQIPQGMREAINAAYTRAGVESPRERQKK